MNNPKTCPECGMPLVQCDNCEEYGCPDCNEEWVVTSDESVLCPECSADIRAEYNKATENGTKVCGSCAASRMRMPMESENVNTLKITKTGQTASTLTTVQITAKIGRKRQNGIPRRKTLPRRRRGARKSPESYPAVNGLRGWPCRASWHRMIAGSDTYPKRRRSGR